MNTHSLRQRFRRILTTLCCMVVLTAGSTHAQAQSTQSATTTDTSKPNFHTARREFYERWQIIQQQRTEMDEAKKKEAVFGGTSFAKKKAGYKSFKRWEWYWATRVNADGTFPSPEQYEQEWRRYQQQRNHSALIREMAAGTGKGEKSLNIWTNWQHLGPFGTPPTSGSSGSGGSGLGRITCIAFGGSEDTIYVGTPASGLWRSVNRGSSWGAMSTELPPHGVGCVAVDPRGNGRVYMGTSRISIEAVTNWGSTRNGIGLYRSNDRGQTWTQVLSITANVNRILIHPTNPDTLFAACSDGIRRSNDGGATWITVATGNIDDIEFHPGNPSIIYATSRRTSGMFATIWRSTTGGTTNSFSQIMTNIPAQFGRIAIAVSPAQPNWLYAMCSDSNTVGFRALYRSTDTGSTWSARVSPGSLSTLLGSQAFVNFAFAVSPTNAQVVSAGGLDFWRSNDGASTGSWEKKTDWQAGASSYLHADQWDIVYPPGSNGSVVYIGNDGGIYRSTNSGDTWTAINGNMSNMTLYRLGIDPTHSTMTVVGAQDNGTSRYRPYVNGTWHPTWEKIYGGDGMESLVSPSTNNEKIYTMIQNGKLYVSSNWGSSYSEDTPSDQLDNNGDGRGYWVTPMIFDPTRGCVLTGYNRIYAVKDNDPNFPEVGHRQASVAFPNGNQLAVAMALSSDGGTMYVATINATSDTFRLYRGTVSTVYYTPPMSAVTFSYPNVSSWTQLSGGPTTQPVASIATHPTDPDVVYVTNGRNGGVFKSVNKGRIWTNITGSLPQVSVNSIVCDADANKPHREGLYIGTDFGVYYRDNAMGDWDVFDIGNGFGLPNSPVMELEVHESGNKLRAATFGRGLYESALYTPSNLTKYYPVSFGRNSDSYWVDAVKIWAGAGTVTTQSGDNNGYLDATRSTTLSIDVYAGGYHLVELTRGIAAGASSAPTIQWRVWIDVNRDGTFDDDGELVGTASSSAGSNTATFWLTIPSTYTQVGLTRMRVAMCVGGTPSHNTPFTTGEVEDYLVNVKDCINFGGVLSAYPVAANSATILWNGSTSSEYELRYRVKNTQTWSYSSAISQPYAQYPDIFQCELTGLTANTYYEIQVRASCGATPWGYRTTQWLPGTPFTIRTIPSSAPYCASFAMPQQGAVADNETYITGVKLTQSGTVLLNHTSLNDFGYQKFGYSGWGFPMASLPTGTYLWANLTAEEIRPPDFNSLFRRWKIWIDLDQDTVFESNEVVYDSQNSTSSLTQSGWMYIPASGTVYGTTRMRVSMKGIGVQNTTMNDITPCEALDYGEVQDYKITLFNPNARGSGLATDVDERGERPSVSLRLAPNPATDELQVSYTCLSGGTATIDIADLFGRVLRQVEQPCEQGGNTFSLSIRDLPSGSYTLRIRSMDRITTQNFTVLR